MSTAPTDLEQLQRWMQAVIVHPGGVVEGVGSAEARRHLDVDPEQIEAVVAPSRALSSLDRLAVYSQAYYARLLECLRAEFPMLCQAVGEEVFDQFAAGYLQAYPSRSYTLGLLGASFAAYLRQTRPASSGDSWPDFLIDLATLEWNFNEVFDGPGVEDRPLLDAERLKSIPPDDWPQARLVPAPCLRLLALDYPVHRYYRAVRQDQEPPAPAATPTWLAITRREYVVRHIELTGPQHQLLGDLIAGRCVGEAIARVAEDKSWASIESLARDLQDWFRIWTAEGFFLAVELAAPAS